MLNFDEAKVRQDHQNGVDKGDNQLHFNDTTQNQNECTTKVVNALEELRIIGVQELGPENAKALPSNRKYETHED